MLSVFSTALPNSGFLLPRTVDATAAIFTEPDTQIPRTTISRQDSGARPRNDPACNRPIINLGPKVNAITRNPVVDKLTALPPVKKLMNIVQKVQTRTSEVKMHVYDKLRISCLFPRIIHPFEPILEYSRCKLGLNDDGFMEAAQCNELRCEESLEDKEISHDLGPPPMKMMNLNVQTMSDCFGEMRQVTYGARVLAKIVNDTSCDNPQYAETCKELMEEGRMIDEDLCTTPE